MTYPNYPVQQPGYPPVYPPAQPPGYPPGYPPQQQQPGYPPQQPQQYAPAPPAPPQNLSIDDFYDQPAASGKSIAGWFQTPGQSIAGVIARTISRADIRPQTDMQTKQPRYYSDGTPMTTMTVPLLVTPSPDFPDGRAAWIVGPGDRPDLEAAMEAAGCKPRTVPEPGAVVTITFTGLKQIPGFGAPKKMKTVTYQRPAGAGGNGQAPAGQPQPVQQVAPQTQYAPAPQYAAQSYPPPVQYAQQPPNPTTQTPYVTAPAPSTAPVTSAPPATAGYPPGAPQPPFSPPPGYDYTPVQPPQYQQPAPPTNGAASAPPGSTPGAPPTAAASPSEYAVPGTLSPEQEARLRQLTGQ